MPNMNLKSHADLKSVGFNEYVYRISFDTNNTSAPDGVDSREDDGETTLARTGVGDYTITLPANGKPYRMITGLAQVLGDESGLDAKVVSYDNSTGVLALTVYQTAQAPTGTITCATKANLVDGETITIGDGINAPKVFEFDVPPDGVAGSNIVVDVSGATTAADVAAILAPLIASNLPSLSVTDNLDGTISLAHKIPGTAGNVTITETVTHASFVVTGMSGGTARSPADTNNKRIQVMCLFTRSGGGLSVSS